MSTLDQEEHEILEAFERGQLKSVANKDAKLAKHREYAAATGEIVLTRERITHLLRKNLSYLASEYGVKKIGLFGSYGVGSPTEASDIDLVVEFSRPVGFRFIDLAEFLEELLGKPVDLLTPAGIEGIRIPEVAQAIQDNVVYV
ncbi:MAG: nucleotidyltransferase family protein [Gammaproteobacteria bacterium]|nr:nucleotidyltransferase family protein [Gammaproteobacteria bacterium]